MKNITMPKTHVEFEVGDRVRINCPRSGWHGHTGQIVNTCSTSNYSVEVIIMGEKFASRPTFQPSCIVLLPPFVNVKLIDHNGNTVDSWTVSTETEALEWFSTFGIPHHHVKHHHNSYFYILQDPKVAELAIRNTKKPTLSDDEKLAKFIGLRSYNEKFYSFPPHFKPGSIHAMYVDKDNLQFKTSWDWLMPVLEKIEEIEGRTVTITAYCKDLPYRYSCCIGYKTMSLTRNSINKMFLTSGNSKMATVYKSVIKYVTWYLRENK